MLTQCLVPLQEPKLTTSATRRTPFGLLVALDENYEAIGSLYLDDGESLVPNATRLVQVSINLLFIRKLILMFLLVVFIRGKLLELLL